MDRVLCGCLRASTLPASTRKRTWVSQLHNYHIVLGQRGKHASQQALTTYIVVVHSRYVPASLIRLKWHLPARASPCGACQRSPDRAENRPLTCHCWTEPTHCLKEESENEVIMTLTSWVKSQRNKQACPQPAHTSTCLSCFSAVPPPHFSRLVPLRPWAATRLRPYAQWNIRPALPAGLSYFVPSKESRSERLDSWRIVPHVP